MTALNKSRITEDADYSDDAESLTQPTERNITHEMSVNFL